MIRIEGKIVFAMANPDPEIMPEEAAPYVRIMATWRIKKSIQKGF